MNLHSNRSIPMLKRLSINGKVMYKNFKGGKLIERERHLGKIYDIPIGYEPPKEKTTYNEIEKETNRPEKISILKNPKEKQVSFGGKVCDKKNKSIEKTSRNKLLEDIFNTLNKKVRK